uniref:Cilia and flagella associated protein 54 n=1 Tax=Leptobrachium leishanense TaxID=445787 RepID=A0A8C5N1B0_9ANUR
MEPLPATFYGDIDHKNPVIITFENEIKQLLGFVRRAQRAAAGESLQRDTRRGSNTLFHIWLKYKPRLPAWYYQEKLLKVGDSLVQIKEYRLALYHCYGRYLEQFCSVDTDEIMDVNQFQSSFFPNGTDDKKAGLTFHALQGRCICIYQLVKTSDPNLQNEESMKKCLNILSFLQLIMQVVLPQENLCWLIFNGTLYIYTICRHLMVRGYSAKALEFVLWASVCMESSVPLLSVHYLTWRATLYTAVCQCYFDCWAGVHAEVFARRALGKINELSQLENMSSSSFSQDAKNAFKEATTKMAVMIFKRAVFESRRKPKGILRPKQKSNLKDVEKLAWPRTNTEKLLVEMFDNSAAQFLAIIEALSDSNRRVLQAGPPVPDEPEIHDVIDELFFAGIDILSGGYNKAERPGNQPSAFCKLLKPSSLLDLAVEERDAISAEAAVKFAKLAYSYECWDVFDAIISPIYSFLQGQDNSKWKKEEMDLKLLISAQPLLSGKKHKHGIHITEKDLKQAEISGSMSVVGFRGESLADRPPDDHITLAETVFSCVYNSKDVQPDRDIVTDVLLFLWHKCKTGLHRITAATSEGSKFIQRSELNSKWIYILCILYEAMQRSNIINTDAVIMGEAALRLAGISESIADSMIKQGKKSDRSSDRLNMDTGSQSQISNKHIYIKKDPVTQLSFAYETLEKATKGMSLARSQGIAPDEASLIDHYCGTLGVKSPHFKHTTETQNNPSKSLANSLMMMDLQLELILTQHRVSVKLLNLLQGDDGHLRASKSSQNLGSSRSICFPSEPEIIAKIKKNKLSQAIFLMQKAVMSNVGNVGVSPNKLLEDSEKLIQKAEAEENSVYIPSVKKYEALKNGKKHIPPSPILISRTENSMVFKPAPFEPQIKVSWYCLYGRCVTGPNLKVRLNDHHLSGTGEEIPANGSNVLEVTGLQANEKYVFAVAGYSSDGALIGDSIGESSKPIVAFPPLSIPATWAHLAQSAYQVGNYQVAKKACLVLWNYFVLPSDCTSSDIVAVSVDNEDSIVQKRLCHDAISKSSPILLQLFLRSIFIYSDINIKEGALFCDSVCDNGVLRKGQMCRIAECERLLVALDVCSWQDDSSYALQAIVQCYGLIAPLIYHRIPSVPVVQILIKCLVVLQEIPNSTWQKKQAGVTEGVLHMIACMVYYAAKVLRSWEEYDVAIAIIEIGKNLLDISYNTTSLAQTSGNDDTETTKEGSEKIKGLKKNLKKKFLGEKVNEQLAVLEQNLLKLTKPSDEITMTGQEDPLILHSVVSCWPPNKAYREVMKFKKKPRFLEFFVQLVQREVYEEKFSRVLEWSDAVFEYLKRRNDYVFGKKKNEEAVDVTASTDSLKRYTTVLIEYHKDQKSTTVDQPRKPDIAEKPKKSIVKPKMQRGQRDQQKNVEEDLKNRAFASLVKFLTPIVARYVKRKRLFDICKEESLWRSQMNHLLALTHFSILQKKLHLHFNNDLQHQSNSYRVLDPEIFSLHHAGTVVMTTEDAEEEESSSPGHLHSSLKLDLTSGAKVTDSNDFSEPTTKRSDEDTPRTQMTNENETPRSAKEEEKHDISVFVLLDHLQKTFIHLKRALVLAHRGGYWTLLQNTCRTLWNVTLQINSAIKQVNVSKESFPITKDLLNNEIWKPLYFAADMLLNMLVILQDNCSIKVVDADKSFSVPSAMGGIEDEDGGSSLTFEYPFDDVTVVDLRCVCHLVLKAIEVLHHLEKWESLVHIAIQFNLLTHERYTEQVTPLLLHAQRMLAARICESHGTESTELIFNTYQQEHEIHCRNYIGKNPQVLNKDWNPSADRDAKRHIVHSDGSQMKALVRVPVNVMDTLACFRESLQKCKYPSRALRHSRKLLSLFLAHSKGLNSQDGRTSQHTKYGKVGFSQGTMQSHQLFPPDLSEEEFKSGYTIESKAIPPSHLSTVIASYDKTIEILHSENQQGLKAQALHELGNLHLYARNKRAAFKCWCQALDETLNMPDALNSWRELDSSPDSTSNGRSKDYSEKFLCRAGIWGCLLAAVITAKMSRYILTSNLRKRTECCMLSALLFKALFQASLPHPSENRDYALYEIGEGCEISELIPGIDLFSDRYRADVNTVVACLSFLVSELHSAGQNLVVLPLLTLYQYFVSMVCRDPARSIEGRLIKIKVLSDLHLFAEACHEVSVLNLGKQTPRRSHTGFRPSGQPKAIEDIFNHNPSPAVNTVYDNMTTNKSLLAKMYFILKLTSTINAIPEEVERCVYENEGGKLQNSKTEDGSLESTCLKGDDSDILVQLVSDEDLTLPKLKWILLSEAEKRVNSVLQDLHIKHQGLLTQCPAGDLEMAIEARLHLSEVAWQRHQTPLSVAMAYSAMTLLQDAEIFTMNKEDTEHIENRSDCFSCSPCDTEARERLSIRAWLKCRLALCTVLLGQVHGLTMQDQDILDAATGIAEGIREAETLSDFETQAWFMLKSAILDIQEGHPKNGVQLQLENITHLLEGKHYVSPTACLTLAQSYILLADLMEMEREENPQVFWAKQLSFYNLAQTLLINQCALLGEIINYSTTNPVLQSPLLPLKNRYLPHVNLLAKVKLRIGNVMSLKAYSLPNSPMDASHFLPSLTLQTTALELCRTSSFRENDVEAELLFQKGKLERQMFILGDCEKSLAIKTFSEAICVSREYDQNLGLIKKSYLEIALLYLHKANLEANETDLLPITETKETSSKRKVDVRAEKDGSGKPLNASDFYRLLTWIAIRAATQAGDAMLACKQLVGLDLDHLQTGSDENIPHFAIMDLFVSFKNHLPDDGQFFNILKPYELAASPNEEGTPTGNLHKGSISWVQLIRYHHYLLRLNSMVNLSGFSRLVDNRSHTGDTMYPSVFYNRVSTRLAGMHMFLKKFLKVYDKCYIDDFPPELLNGLEMPPPGFPLLPKTSASREYQQTPPSPLKDSSNVSADNKQDVESGKMTINSYGKELCIQWYFPTLESADQRKSMVLLLYAYNKQNISITDPRKCDQSNLICGQIWIPLSQVLSLHERLSVLKERAELSLQDEPDSQVEKQKRSAHSSGSKKDVGIIQISEDLQELTKQCCSEIQTLLCTSGDSKMFSQAPFDITLPSLISLEKIFDLTHGCMLMKGSLSDWMLSLFT